MPSLRDNQVAALKQMLAYNAPASEDPAWKVLVMDGAGQDVLVTSLSVPDLRAQFVTLHLRLSSERPALPDIPAVYFVAPTEANIRAITEDLGKELYAKMYVNFCSPVPHRLLQEMAQTVAREGTADGIAQVWDQYLDFQMASPFLFNVAPALRNVTGAPPPIPGAKTAVDSTYLRMNDPRVSEEYMESLTDAIAAGLFSVVVTLGHVPVIRGNRDAAAEMVARKLDARIREHLMVSGGGGALFDNAASPYGRPLLLIVDRDRDLSPMISHPWTYEALVDDVLGLKANRVTVRDATKTSTYDLNSRDYFWGKYATKSFPEVAEEIDTELNKYMADSSAFTRTTGIGSDVNDLSQLDSSSQGAGTSHLRAAFSALPELQERKRILDTHMNIATALMQGIKERSMDSFVEAEENLYKLSKPAILDILQSPVYVPEDKLRFLMYVYLTTEVRPNDLADYERAAFGDALPPAWTYLKRQRQISQLTLSSVKPVNVGGTPQKNQNENGELLGGFGHLSSRLTESLREKSGLGGGIDSLISGIKNLLPATKNLILTRIVEALMDPANASTNALQEAEHLFYLDPRAPQGKRAPAHASFNDAIVFVVGGGSYAEYTNLCEYMARAASQNASGPSAASFVGLGASDDVALQRRITYGSTEMLRAREFVDVLGDLAGLS